MPDDSEPPLTELPLPQMAIAPAVADALVARGLPTVIVLASGRGERFAASGGSTHQLPAMLGGKPVLEHTLAAVRASGLPWHLEQRGLVGMGDSIAAAVAATATAYGWLILPADLPLIQSDTLRAVAYALVRGLSPQSVVVPMFAGQRGHPVGFAQGFRAALLALAGPQGAAKLIPQDGAIELPVDDAGIQFDIDTTDDLRRAQAWLEARGRGSVGGN